MKKQHLLAIGIVVLVCGITLTVVFTSRRKKDWLSAIREIIAKGTGQYGEDASTVLVGTKPDPSFVEEANRRVEQIYNARGFWGTGFGTDEDAIFSALRGLNRNQLATVKERFAAKKGETLDSFLRNELDSEEFDQYLQLLKTAQ